MTKYAIDVVLGANRYTLVVCACDRDEAFSIARDSLCEARLFSASLQGTARPASQCDIDRAWTP